MKNKTDIGIIKPAPDDFLGRDVRFIDKRLTIVGRDPGNGWRLAGPGFASCWISDALWQELINAQVIEWA